MDRLKCKGIDVSMKSFLANEIDPDSLTLWSSGDLDFINRDDKKDSYKEHFKKFCQDWYDHSLRNNEYCCQMIIS